MERWRDGEMWVGVWCVGGVVMEDRGRGSRIEACHLRVALLVSMQISRSVSNEQYMEL
jgi:hypothetical protein